MAVAVKTPPVAPASSSLSMPIVSLVGAAYVVASLAIIFGVLPYVWQAATGWTGIASGVVLGLVMTAVAAALAVLGARLFGPHRPAGARAGVFAGVVGFVLVLLLTRWVSLWVEYWIYANHWLGDSPKVGLAITGAVGAAMLVGLGYLFFRPEADKWLVRLESQGWFSATSYKGQQGMRVRRGTILGILLIAGSGVYTMMNNGLLRRMPENWSLNIPFTGVVVVQEQGDAGPLLKKELSPQDKDQLQVVSHGGSRLQDGKVVTEQEFRSALQSAIQSAADLDAGAKVRLQNELAEKDVSEILNIPGSSEPLIAALGPSAQLALPPPALPTAVLRVSMYTLTRKVNDVLKRDYVRVQSAGDSRRLKAGSVITKAEFDEAAAKVSEQGTKPVAVPPYGATGPFAYQPLTLLPALQVTLPLLLIVASLWLAWRVVSYPPFADFLIATEAELNKVSWTTRPRLIQDTIVVLVTVLLMAVFLFSMDQLWRVVLSWKPIGVLQISDDQSEKNKSAEQKPW
jgi:preprotein translocase SecE subunit